MTASTPWVCDVCGAWATKVRGGWLCGEHARQFREWLRKHPPADPQALPRQEQR